MAKSKVGANAKVSALGMIDAVKKENEKKEKAFQESVVYEEAKQEPVEVAPQIMPKPVKTRVVVEEQPSKSMGDLFDKHDASKETVCFKMGKDVLKEVDKICKNFNISRTAFINKAVEVLLDTYEH